MRLSVHPVLRELRALYDVEGVMARFRAYVSLIHSGPEFLPLGAFSPMGKRQAEYLDALISLDAEGIAAQACEDMVRRLHTSPDCLRLLLVVVDEPRNGWTQRWLTDAEWRFQGKYDGLPQDRPAVGFDRWVTVQLWTDSPVSFQAVFSEVCGSVVRALRQRRLGLPITLRDHLTQEGEAARFAGEHIHINAEELAYTREVLCPHLDSTHWPTIFAALYGDEAARAVGFPPLGLSHRAGFALALDGA
ncbi:hypothetical protein V3W47_17735 [Deinococcus sp. YIM 134068]|uniref:hypothetical protein n=1 Tax=Deinococcus lichenicola TaxID=3118910 RepID=UPI002F95015D